MLQSSQRRCGDARDRIFALQSEAHIERETGLKPDYRIEPSLLYARFTLNMLQKQSYAAFLQPVVLLALAGLRDSRLDSPRVRADTLPSWVPNLDGLPSWAEQKSRSYVADRNTELLSNEDMAKVARKLRVSSVDPAILCLKGRVFGTVSEILPLAGIPEHGHNDLLHVSHSEKLAAIRSFVDWFDAVGASSVPIVTGNPCQDDVDSNFFTYPSAWTYHARLDAKVSFDEDFLNLLQVTWPGAGAPDWERKLPIIEELLLAQPYNPLWRQRRLCYIRTEQATDIAWLPLETQEGDKVCIFAGSFWPFVIRSLADGTFALIGDGHTLCTPLSEALGGQIPGTPKLVEWLRDVGNDRIKSSYRYVFSRGDEIAGALENSSDTSDKDEVPEFRESKDFYPVQDWFAPSEPLGLNMAGPTIDRLIDGLGWITLR